MTTMIDSLLQTNTYQLVMATDGQLSFVTFLYEEIQWTDSGRTDSVSAIAGIDNGALILDLPGSGFDDVRNLVNTSNVGVDGMWMYRVDSSDIIHPGLP